MRFNRVLFDGQPQNHGCIGVCTVLYFPSNVQRSTAVAFIREFISSITVVNSSASCDSRVPLIPNITNLRAMGCQACQAPHLVLYGTGLGFPQDGTDPAVIPVAACKGTNARTPYSVSSGMV
jgi:hypothetical protein